MRKVTPPLPSNTDGMTADRDGNVYMTALTLNGLLRLDGKTGQVSRFVFHPEMSWPDTLAWGPDGSLYVVANHLNVWVDGRHEFRGPAGPQLPDLEDPRRRPQLHRAVKRDPSMQPDLICLGEPLLEFTEVTGDTGEPVYIRGFGGDTSNCAIAAARQGAAGRLSHRRQR